MSNPSRRLNDDVSEQELQNFTSWKLDVLDAISCDSSVQDIDVRVAFRLMQHVNARTRDAHPSLERLAAQVGVSRDTVMRSLARLCDPTGGTHWIDRTRSDRTQPYFYSFRTDRMNVVLDGKIDREEKAREVSIEKKRKRFEVAAVQPREVANGEVFEVANGPVSKLHACNPNTYVRTTLEEHLPISGADGREDTYPREGIPTKESDFGTWIRSNIPDQTKHREALRLLRERRMTLELLRGMAA